MSTNNSSTHTFWELIKSNDIVIPPLQRDYAQGRDKNPEIEQIRNSLIDEIYESLKDDKSLVLNFIYGEKGEEKFIPIDGQQRLTTLFLLHWYIFMRAQYKEGLGVLKRFSYQTRVTSERFCENLCDAEIDCGGDDVSKKIKECYWLTGNFLKDPTIKSMLTMLDAIHKKFSVSNDFVQLKDKLTGDSCPITFLWLPMDNFQKTNDLYIKMNARGKLLSDFEIFKAKLQNSALVKSILGPTSSEQDVILYISKYNNQYAEFFYQIFQNEYDEAMMSFIKEMVRDAYLSYVSRCGVPQKDYRDEYNKIRSMNGSIFSRYIENGGVKFNACQNNVDAIVKGIHKATEFIDLLLPMSQVLQFENTLSKEYFDERTLFINGYRADTLSDDVIRFAIYSYLIKFGIPSDYDSKNAYCEWKRFVFNVVTNSPFKSRREDVCEAFVFFEDLIDLIAVADEAAILNAVSSIPENKMTAAIKLQVKEEVIKAKLMKDVTWKRDILEAENYFLDGQIGFLLENSWTGPGNWDIKEFEKYLALYETIFDANKRMKPEVDEKIFERALLCMKDTSGNNTAHLLKQPNSTTSWGFLGKNYKDFLSNAVDARKRKILKALVDRLSQSVDYNAEMNNIVNNIQKSDYVDGDAWKLPFIQNDLFDVLMGYYKFKNCINLSEDRKEVLMIAGTTVRAYSMELYTYLLYRKMIEEKIKGVKTVLYTTASMNDHEGFPLRYIEIKGTEIGYSYNASDVNAPYLYKANGTLNKMTFDDALAASKKL